MATVGRMLRTTHGSHIVYLNGFEPETMDVAIVAKDARRIWVDNYGGAWGWSITSARAAGLTAPGRQHEFVEVGGAGPQPFPWDETMPDLHSSLWTSELVHQ